MMDNPVSYLPDGQSLLIHPLPSESLIFVFSFFAFVTVSALGKPLAVLFCPRFCHGQTYRKVREIPYFHLCLTCSSRFGTWTRQPVALLTSGFSQGGL